jgi:DNA-directed RNA polymerase specialized sigma24 family protein
MDTIEDFAIATKPRGDGGESSDPWKEFDRLIRIQLPTIGFPVQAADMDDIVQEVSMTTFQRLLSIADYSEEENRKFMQTPIRTWIRVVAKRRIIDNLRRMSCQNQVGFMKFLFGLSRVPKKMRESIFQEYKKPFGPGTFGDSNCSPGSPQIGEDAHHDCMHREETRLYDFLVGTTELKDYEKRLVLLKKIEGRSWDKIATIMQTQFPSDPPPNEPTLRKRLSRALTKLKNILPQDLNLGRGN